MAEEKEGNKIALRILNSWQKDSENTYNLTTEHLHELNQKICRVYGRTLERQRFHREVAQGTITLAGKVCASRHVDIGRYTLSVSIWSDHYGYNPDKVVLRLYESAVFDGVSVKFTASDGSVHEVNKTELDNAKQIDPGLRVHGAELGVIEFTAPCRKLDYGVIANGLRQIADKIDVDQYTPGANTDFAMALPILESILDEKKSKEKT